MRNISNNSRNKKKTPKEIPEKKSKKLWETSQEKKKPEGTFYLIEVPGEISREISGETSREILREPLNLRFFAPPWRSARSAFLPGSS